MNWILLGSGNNDMVRNLNNSYLKDKKSSARQKL